jgi:cytochrome c5
MKDPIIRALLRSTAIVACAAASTVASAQQMPAVTDSATLFEINCAVCHGDNLEGAALGPSLREDLRHGDSNLDIVASISNGYEAEGMPAWGLTLTEAQVRNLALLITETRANVGYETFNYDSPLIIPEDLISTELHDFRIESVAEGLDALPFSIAPLPDGRLLLTEKKLGVSIIGLDGKQSPLISGTPQAYDDKTTAGYISTLGIAAKSAMH